MGTTDEAGDWQCGVVVSSAPLSRVRIQHADPGVGVPLDVGDHDVEACLCMESEA